MQKIIISILLLIMASVPITAHALTVFINDTQYGPSEGGTISVLHNDGQLQCFSVTDPAVADPTSTPTVPATFVFLEAGDIKDVVMSDVLCRNISPATLTLTITAVQQVTHSATQWYFMSLQGSFYNLAGGAQPSDDFTASASVSFFETSIPIGLSIFPNFPGNFIEFFGPQNPPQIVNAIDCDCESVTATLVPVLSVGLAAGDGIYLFGSAHFGLAPTAEEAAAYLSSLAARMDVHNAVNVNSNGRILVDLFGANSVVPVTNSDPIVVKFDVRSVDIKSLKFGPVGGPFVAPVSPQTFVDLNKDKIEDVRLRFPNPHWTCDDKVAVLTGNFIGTNTGFTATQNITPQPCH